MSFFFTLGSVLGSVASIFIASVSWLSANDATNGVQTKVESNDLMLRTLESVSAIFHQGFEDLLGWVL